MFFAFLEEQMETPFQIKFWWREHLTCVTKLLRSDWRLEVVFAFLEKR